MSSSFNTPWIKHKLVVTIYSNTETSLAMSGLAFSVAPPGGRILKGAMPMLDLMLIAVGFYACKMTYRVSQNWHTFCTPFNFIKYWPIFKRFSLSESGQKFVIILSIKIPPHLKYIATLPREMSFSWSNIWKQDLCNYTVLEINDRKQHVYSVSYCLK